MNFARYAVPAALVLTVSGCGINSIPTYEEAAKARWADVQASYQRRADLIPNLVETVRGFATQEREVLTQVTQARASATQVQVSPDQLSDPAAVQRFQEAQGNLSGALGRLLVTVEKYPELRSQENFLALQSQLEGTENRINVSIRDYNEAVRVYNTEVRTFPGIIGAKVIHGAEPLTPYQATAPNADQAPAVKF
ncbi:MAG: LemA family protein [Sphingomonadaceae bacterium]|nr:LemA family protein [Sphingomonadaceae bacterium]